MSDRVGHRGVIENRSTCDALRSFLVDVFWSFVISFAFSASDLRKVHHGVEVVDEEEFGQTFVDSDDVLLGLSFGGVDFLLCVNVVERIGAKMMRGCLISDNWLSDFRLLLRRFAVVRLSWTTA